MKSKIDSNSKDAPVRAIVGHIFGIGCWLFGIILNGIIAGIIAGFVVFWLASLGPAKLAAAASVFVMVLVWCVGIIFFSPNASDQRHLTAKEDV